MDSWKRTHIFDTGSLHHYKICVLIKGHSQRLTEKISSLIKGYLLANAEKMSQTNVNWHERGKGSLESCFTKVKPRTNKHRADTSDSWRILGGSGKVRGTVRRGKNKT